MSPLFTFPRQTSAALLLAAVLLLPTAVRAADAAPAPKPDAAPVAAVAVPPAPAPVAEAPAVPPPAPAKGATAGEWTQDFDAALALAKSKNLPLLLNFTGSDWCGWCELMDKQVFNQADWKKYATTHTVLVTLDYPKDETRVPAAFKERNNKLRDQYKVEGYPTFVVLDSDGATELGRLGAAPDITATKFIRQLAQTYDRRPAGIEARCKALKPEDAAAYKEALASYQKTMAEVQTWLATNPEENAENMAKYQKYQETVIAATKKLSDLEVEARAAALTPEQATAYRAASKAWQAAQQELDAWLTTKPERNADNDKKYAAFKDKLETSEKAVMQYEL